MSSAQGTRRSGKSGSANPTPQHSHRFRLPFETHPGSVGEPDRIPPEGDRAPSTHTTESPHEVVPGRPESSTLDPWAEQEPIYGQRERNHALSPTPGTPPMGNAAAVSSVSPNARDAKPSEGKGLDQVFSFKAAASQSRRDHGIIRKPEPPVPKEELRDLGESVRVEMEVGRPGRWLCGLCEKASQRAAQVSLRSAIWSGFGLPEVGARVRLLVAPRSDPPFSLFAKVVEGDEKSARAGDFTVSLVLDTQDTMALTRWQTTIERAAAR